MICDEEHLLTLPGTQHEQFSVAFSLAGVSETEHFVARETELSQLHKTLNGSGSRRVAVVHGLGGMGSVETAAHTYFIDFTQTITKAQPHGLK